jgi:hypothetical protein
MATPSRMATENWLQGVVNRANKQPGGLLKRQIEQIAKSPSAAASGSAEPMADDDDEVWPPQEEELLQAAEAEEARALRSHGLKGVPISEWLQGLEEGDEEYDSRMAAAEARRDRAPPRPSAAHGFGPGQNPPPPPPWPPAAATPEEPMAEEEPAAEEEEPQANPREWPDQPEDFEGMPELVDELPSCEPAWFFHDQHSDHRWEYQIAMVVDKPKAWQDCHNKMEPLGCNGCLCYYTISEVVGL